MLSVISAGDAAGRDPAVVDRAWAAAQPPGGLDVAPDDRGVDGGVQDDDAAEERVQARAAGVAPAVEVRPLRELADGHEGDRETAPGDQAVEMIGQPCFEDRGGDVGVDDDSGHARPARREA